MSILSDSEIHQLCVAPEDHDEVDHLVYDALIAEQNRKGWPLTDHAVEQLKNEFRQLATVHIHVDPADFKAMIEPYCPSLVRECFTEITKPMSDGQGGIVMTTIPTLQRGVLSFGQSSYGYDVRLSDKLKLFSNINSAIVDPKNFDESCLVDALIREDLSGRYVILPPNSYLLGHTVEYFRMPRDVTAIFLAKSTYARCGVSINCTPAEAGWEGNLVLEIANQTTLPVKIYIGEGIAQSLYFRGNQPCAVSYADRGGKYQGQTALTLAKV